jgi:diguanylate cyclase (GGDEF)-like protein
MPKLTPAPSFSEPDPDLLDKLARARQVCLAVVALIALATLAGRLIPALGQTYPQDWQYMTAESALAALLSALGLRLSEARHSGLTYRLSQMLSALVALLAIVVLCEYAFHISLGIDVLPPPGHGLLAPFFGRMSPQGAGGFALLGIALLLVRAQGRFAVRLADLFTAGVGLMVLILASGYLFNAFGLFGLTVGIKASPQTLLCLLLLTLVTLSRRAENGVFSILLARGIGGRIARLLFPFVLVLPFLRETARSHLISADRFPAHYTTAILASVSALLYLVLLLFLAWHINSMEAEIHGLSLRDELTGLYNLRGFHLLAEQAMQLAYRSELPFSVLFIDVDNLKQINDTLGHYAGSGFLVETSEILKATFRETDVIGRVGGDEFAVAGQFSRTAISLAARRLDEFCAHRNAVSDREFAISFSVGHVTSGAAWHQSLDELLHNADQVMYQEKRRKKLQLN